MKKRFLSILLVSLLVLTLLPMTALAMCYADPDRNQFSIDYLSDGSSVTAIHMNYCYYDTGGMNHYYFYNVAFMETPPVSQSDFYVDGTLKWSDVVAKMNANGGNGSVVLDTNIKSSVGYINRNPVAIPFLPGASGTLVTGSLVVDNPNILSQLDPDKTYTAVLICTHSGKEDASSDGGTFYTGVHVEFSLKNYSSVTFDFGDMGGTDFTIPVRSGKSIDETATSSNPEYIAMSDEQKAIVDNWDSIVLNPTAEGYVFGGWYSDSNLETPADFSAPVTQNTKYYAKWLKSIDVPTPTNGLTYNGSEQVGVAAGTGYTVTGAKATNAGNYTAVATLEDGYIWSDKTTDDKNISWSISPATLTGTSAETQEYTASAITPKITVLAGNIPVDTYTIGPWSGDLIEPGTYTATITGTGNFTGEFPVTFTIKDSHTLVKVDGKAPTEEESGWKDYYVCSSCDAYFEDAEGLIPIEDLDAWKSEGGNGYLPKIHYVIIEGANSSWLRNNDPDLLISSDAPFSKFDCVKIDGVVIDPSNYTAFEGSTKIKLHVDYLTTLKDGSHTIEIVSIDGSASTEFTVRTSPVPATGESSSTLLPVAIGFMSISAIAFVISLEMKRRNYF